MSLTNTIICRGYCTHVNEALALDSLIQGRDALDRGIDVSDDKHWSSNLHLNVPETRTNEVISAGSRLIVESPLIHPYKT